MFNLGVRDTTTDKSLGRYNFTVPPQNGDILIIGSTRYKLQRVWDDAGGLLLEAQREPRLIRPDFFGELPNKLRGVQLCDSTAHEADKA